MTTLILIIKNRTIAIKHLQALPAICTASRWPGAVLFVIKSGIVRFSNDTIKWSTLCLCIRTRKASALCVLGKVETAWMVRKERRNERNERNRRNRRTGREKKAEKNVLIVDAGRDNASTVSYVIWIFCCTTNLYVSVQQACSGGEHAVRGMLQKQFWQRKIEQKK
jgi:hypothetical protein